MKKEAATVLLGSLEGERDYEERDRGGCGGNCSCWGEEEERVQEKGVQGGVLEGLGRRLQEETSTLSTGPFLSSCLWDPWHLQGPRRVLCRPPSPSHLCSLFLGTRLDMVVICLGHLGFAMAKMRPICPRLWGSPNLVPSSPFFSEETHRITN